MYTIQQLGEVGFVSTTYPDQEGEFWRKDFEARDLGLAVELFGELNPGNLAVVEVTPAGRVQLFIRSLDEYASWRTNEPTGQRLLTEAVMTEGLK